LGDVQPLGRLAEAAELGDMDEGAKLPDVHGELLARNSIAGEAALDL
jgi:hypothetical protein